MKLFCVCVQPSRAAGPAARAVRRSRLDAPLPSVLCVGAARAGAGLADGGGGRPFLAAAGGSGGDQAEHAPHRSAPAAIPRPGLRPPQPPAAVAPTGPFASGRGLSWSESGSAMEQCNGCGVRGGLRMPRAAEAAASCAVGSIASAASFARALERQRQRQPVAVG